MICGNGTQTGAGAWVVLIFWPNSRLAVLIAVVLKKACIAADFRFGTSTRTFIFTSIFIINWEYAYLFMHIKFFKFGSNI